MVSHKSMYGIIAVLVATIVIISSAASFYYVEYNQVNAANSTYLRQLERLNARYSSDILIDYGNGSYTWYNDTLMQPGANLYTAIVLVTDGNVNASCCEFGSHLVTGINNVQSTQAKFWWIWTYNSTASWQTAQVGVDELTIYNNSIYGWTLCGSNPQGNPTCSPP